MVVVIRRYIPKDNNCLFTACSYLCEGRQGSTCTALRRAVAEHVRTNPDIDEVILGMPKEEYCTWIQNEMNWGGENEICFLCDKFNVEIQVVMMNASSSTLTYGQGAARRGRIYLLYTGQHYDALVGGEHQDILPEAETCLFSPEQVAAFDAQVVQAANEFYLLDAKKAAMVVKKMLKCGGCGTLLADSAAFQAHCGEVEHDDDFGYECSEVEVEVQGAADVDMWQSFYNMPAEPLSSLYATSFEIDDTTFASLEHYIQWARYKGYNDELASKVLATNDPTEAHALGEYGEGGREDWAQVREEFLMRGLQAKLDKDEVTRAALLATSKPLRVVGAGTWAGVVIEGSSTKGSNALGKLLTKLRAELGGA